MSKRVSDNLRIKRKYLVWLKDAKGLSEASIDKAAAAVSSYQAFLAGKDFRAFHSEQARSFKRRLSSKQNQRTGAKLSQGSINGTLREVKAFFKWLADQPGYKSKITRSDADFLSPDLKSERARRSSCWKPHPSPQQVRKLVHEMSQETVLQRRDRALIAFLFLTGSREGAAISLRIGHVDLANACVQFDGRTVDTKFGKSFTTAFYPIGGEIEQIVRDWIGELKSVHLFSESDPLFPKTKVGVGISKRFEALGILREPWASPSSAAKIFKQAFKDAGLSPFSPHRVRDTLAKLAKDHCRSPEDYKAWSQNMGHDDVLTTFRSYGSVATGRQMELLEKFRKRGPIQDPDNDFDVIE
ncbi:site-specific integrase [Pseudohalocynthiibacter sp. F2068]|jgi:integrase|uniref:tyrosine-type recombinase/integrase n=1 Tax=Pseudohalocynthiibacter sp. F2068 TaxID=2926418 RepID=UPI001FF3943D|nr:site-specific integrase [Pseudohalocynthiibacter sp. F2068]MCK0103441.1 site-specific integrase [Pseudohalocynthiibacter sp. F2068]